MGWKLRVRRCTESLLLNVVLDDELGPATKMQRTSSGIDLATSEMCFSCLNSHVLMNSRILVLLGISSFKAATFGTRRTDDQFYRPS